MRVIIPAAGIGSRIQPLAFSKELLPIGTRLEDEVECSRAISEHLIERMLTAGVDQKSKSSSGMLPRSGPGRLQDAGAYPA
jgi:dTDP-glucose pyrophosphorylase